MAEHIYFHETPMFQNWLKRKGYQWPSDPIKRENLLAQNMREMFEEGGKMEEQSRITPEAVAQKLQPKPTIGRIVRYMLSAEDAEAINGRRTTGDGIADRSEHGLWPTGAQAHIGNRVEGGQEFPMLVVATWDGTVVNGQVFLDGNDVLWVTSAHQGPGPGTWTWPPITR